jgi:hypothetical protein
MFVLFLIQCRPHHRYYIAKNDATPLQRRQGARQGFAAAGKAFKLLLNIAIVE